MLLSGEFFKMCASKKLLTILNNFHSEFFTYRKARVSLKRRLSIKDNISIGIPRPGLRDPRDPVPDVDPYLNRDRPNLHINHTI